MEKPSCSTASTVIPEIEEAKELQISKSRSIYTIDDMKILTKSFDKTQHPSKKRIEKLAKKLDKTPAQVSGWFVRQRTKVPKQGFSIKREREESPDKTQDSSILDALLTSSDEEKEQAAKKICRRSLPANLIMQEPGLEEIISQGENIELTVQNISENDKGFYLDPEESKKLFHQIWKTEKKLPKEATKFLAKRSRKTTQAVRSWFYDQTKKDEKKTCRRSLPANLVCKNLQEEQKSSEDIIIEQGVKNISKNDEGFYLNNEESKTLFREIWKTEEVPPEETLDYLSKRSGKTIAAVRFWFLNETKKERYAKKICRNSLPAVLSVKDPQLEEKISENDNIVTGVQNISENDAGFYLDHEESKKLFREIWKTERVPPKEALEHLSKRSSKTIDAVRLWFQRETKKECDAKKICTLPARSSLPAVLTVKEPQLEEKIYKTEDFVTVENISETDAGFYLDQEESKKLFYEIWKTERKPPSKVYNFLAKRSIKTTAAVRTWFWLLTKKVQ